MEFSLEVEKASSIVRKLKIKIPANVVRNHFDRGLVEVQKTAKLKGFRPGQVPITIVKQYYGDDVRHRVLHRLMDDSIKQALVGEKLNTVGSPIIDTPDHKTGAGEHDHTLYEDRDLSFVATVEVMPEVKVVGYKGVKIKKASVEVTDEIFEKAIQNLRNSQAELVSVNASGGASGDASGNGKGSRPVGKGDFVDVQIAGGLLQDGVLSKPEELEGSKLLEVGSNTWIPGFEENLMGLHRGDQKTFRLPIPEDFLDRNLAGQEAELTVTINEIKERKLAPLDDEFAKQLGYEDLKDLNLKAREYLQKEKIQESEKDSRAQLIGALIEKNQFEVPQAMIEAQTRVLAQEWAQELRGQKIDDKTIESVIQGQIVELMKRAKLQVVASLLLESIAKEESIVVTPDALSAEIGRISASMKVKKEELEEFYAKNSGRMRELEFRLRQEATVKFLLDNAEIA